MEHVENESRIEGLSRVEIKADYKVLFRGGESHYIYHEGISEIYINPDEVSLIIVEKGDK